MRVEKLRKAGMRKEDGYLLTAYDGSYSLIYTDEISSLVIGLGSSDRPSAPFLPAVLPYSEPPTVAEYKQRREGREESQGKAPERKRIEQAQMEAMEALDKEIDQYQQER